MKTHRSGKTIAERCVLYMNKKTKVLLISYSAALIFVAAGLVFTASGGSEGYRISQDNEYRRAMAQLVSSVSEADRALAQGKHADGTVMSGKVCVRLMGAAQSASTALSILPLETYTLEEVSQFLSQLEEFARVKSDDACQGTGFNEQDRQSFHQLHMVTSEVVPLLEQMYQDLAEGNLTIRGWEKQRGLVTDEADTYLEDELLHLLEEFPELPELTYAGKLSADYDSGYQALSGLEEVDQQTAQKVAQSLLEEAHTLRLLTESAGEIPSYYFVAEDTEVPVTIAVTKQGGMPLMYLAEYTPGEAAISEDEAKQIAQEFLVRAGYNELSEYDSREEWGELEIEYVYTDGNAAYLADAITVTVAMDTGKILAMNAEHYLHHHSGQAADPKLTKEEVQEMAIPDGLTVRNAKLIWFTDDAAQTVLCWGFHCADAQGEECFIYADSSTGEQIEILVGDRMPV